MQVADVGLFPVLAEAFGEDVPFLDRMPADVVEQYREAHDQPICLRVLFQQPLAIVERDRDMNIVLANPRIGSRCAPDVIQCHAGSRSRLERDLTGGAIHADTLAGLDACGVSRSPARQASPYHLPYHASVVRGNRPLNTQYGALDGVGVATLSDAQQGRPGQYDLGRDPAG
jgi:hypothetical protein